ncbi:MAG: hypothetical protein ABSC23_16650 [Bryobacteraceae bacterium]|jgi:hypothetical protein
MNMRTAVLALCLAGATLPAWAADEAPAPPRAGKVEIMPLSEIRPGMKGTVWSVFQGTEPEPSPVEIIGRWKDVWGPKEDVILARLGGAAARNNVAGGMSGSPVYIDGKLIGAVALRVGQFTTEAICGITPIELMLEVNELDRSRPDDENTPGQPAAVRKAAIPGDLLGQPAGAQPFLVPIESPVALSGFTGDAFRQFAPSFGQLGITAVQTGGAGSAIQKNTPAPGWQHALNPGETVAGVLVDGDMSVTGLGTVTYNDGRRVLAFGHALFNLGPVDIPMSKGEVLLTLASPLQANKIANATEIVGALRQDRYSGIMGELGAESAMVSVSLKVRSFGAQENALREKDFHFNVFLHQKWTPFLMMLTMYNSLSQLNELADESTYRLTGRVELNGQPGIALSTMMASGVSPQPAPMALATWWADRFNRLYMNNVQTPGLKGVDVTVDVLPERRVAVIENAWVAQPDVRAGDDVAVKALLRPYRGEPLVREFNVHIPATLSAGDHRILLSDADTLNRMQAAAGAADRFMNMPETVSLLNQERSNNKLYVSLAESSPTAYFDDKTLPSLPPSALNVMQAGRTSNRQLVTSPETITEQMALPFDSVVSGSYSLRIHVR